MADTAVGDLWALPTQLRSCLALCLFGYLELLKIQSGTKHTFTCHHNCSLMLPYLCAMIVLVFSTKTYRPESLLKPYHREKRN